MSRRMLLFLYQLLTGLSDTLTGLLLIFLPGFTLHLLHLQADAAGLPFLSYVGVFVLSVGVACLYGASLSRGSVSASKCETVWLLTAITRGFVAIFVAWKIISGVFDPGWALVSLSDAACACLQFIGLSRGWLSSVLD